MKYLIIILFIYSATGIADYLSRYKYGDTASLNEFTYSEETKAMFNFFICKDRVKIINFILPSTGKQITRYELLVRCVSYNQLISLDLKENK